MERLTANNIKELLLSLAGFYEEKKEELSSYDAVVGDGDHGTTLARGFSAGEKAVEDMKSDEPGIYLKSFGRSMMGAMGGAVGPLFGSIFTELSKACAGKKEMGLEEFSNGFGEGLLKVMELGGAVPGDKTMVDALEPAVLALKEARGKNLSLSEGMKAAALAAEQGMKATILMPAKKGRSKYLREKSVGYQDAGATSTCCLFQQTSQFICGREE